MCSFLLYYYLFRYPEVYKSQNLSIGFLKGPATCKTDKRNKSSKDCQQVSLHRLLYSSIFLFADNNSRNVFVWTCQNKRKTVGMRSQTTYPGGYCFSHWGLVIVMFQAHIKSYLLHDSTQPAHFSNFLPGATNNGREQLYSFLVKLNATPTNQFCEPPENISRVCTYARK